MSCSCGIGTLPRPHRRSSYAPLSQTLPMSTTGETDCSTVQERLRASSSLIGGNGLFWEPAGACGQTTLPPLIGGHSTGPSARRHQSWMASNGSLAATANWGITANSFEAQNPRFALAPLGSRRQFGTSPAITPLATTSSMTTASTSLRGPDERLLTPSLTVERQRRSRRQIEQVADSSSNEDCWPLLAVSLTLCAVSLLLLAIGGLFLGVHLRQRARSVPTSDSGSASSAAAAAAAASSNSSTTAWLPTLTTSTTRPPAPTPTIVKVHKNHEVGIDDDLIRSRMRALTDSRIAPCDNFHAFACGRLGEYLDSATGRVSISPLRQPRPSNLLELAGVQLRSELAVAMEKGATQPILMEAYRRCRIAGAAGACLRALRWSAPEAAKSLTQASHLNVTALHIVLSDLFAGVVSELRDLVATSPALTAHTRGWMDSRLSRLYLYVDSVGNGESTSASLAARLSFAIRGAASNDNQDDEALNHCRIESCRPSSPDWSFGSACVCLSNSTEADVAVSLAALRPELYSPSLPSSLAHAFMGARLAESAFAAVGPAYRRRFYSTESEARASAAVGCLSRRLRLTPGGRPLARSVARLAGLRAALAAFLRANRRSEPSKLAEFFVNWAQTQCSLTDTTAATVINWVVIESSGLASEAFVKAFNCTKGDAMMPVLNDHQEELCRFP